MAGRDSTVNQVANDESAAKSNMMDLWRESIERAQKQRQTPTQVMQSEQEARADLEQKIRSGQAPCPTCAARTYQDESDDGGVSFQAAKGINAANAASVIMGHEREHVAAGRAGSDPDDPEGVVKDSSVTLEWKKCPHCGRTYCAGGVTKTTSRPASYAQYFKKPGEIDMLV